MPDFRLTCGHLIYLRRTPKPDTAIFCDGHNCYAIVSVAKIDRRPKPKPTPDPIFLSFLTDQTEIADQHIEPTSAIVSTFNTYATRHNHPPITAQRLGRELSKLGWLKIPHVVRLNNIVTQARIGRRLHTN